MRKTQKIAAIVILVLAALTVFGFWRTRQPSIVAENGVRQSGKPLVVLRPLKTAQRMAQLATLPEEQSLAQEALRLADYDVDLAFDEAVREARLHPAPLTPEALAAKARKEKAEKVLDSEQERAKQLSEDLGKAPPTKQSAIESELIQIEADLDLAQDELDDAKHDLQAAGGDQADRLLAMKQQHTATSQNTQSSIANVQEPQEKPGVVNQARQWWALHHKQMQLWGAKSETESSEARLRTRHDALEAQMEAEKAAVPELAQHSKKSDSTGSSVPPATENRTDTRALLKKTEELTDNQKVLQAYDKRIDAKKEIAAVYTQWIDLVAARQRAVLHRTLVGVGIVLAIAVIALFFSTWTDSLVKRLRIDRRQVQSLRTVARVALQILALFLILLVLLGPPGQLGTFLGLAGAGLTVALKDFIVGFIGWFALMGKNGIRPGDWVEINGVTGEVVEISPFHTVLLETGNWTDSGHPTGRRVTFTNSFAIEGHYFNFSTTGQWLWDELHLVMPSGKDSYSLIDALHKRVTEATRESASEAEREWRSAANSREMSGFSVEPAISVKPVIGGIEVSVRYITRASERYQLRSKLNQAAVELLGGKVEQPVS
jgi:small-conductance mechanosensitive channel